MLFSAGCPLGGRELGVDVPHTFKQLDVGPIFNTQPRLPNYLSTDTVRETPARPGASIYPYVRPTASVCSKILYGCSRALEPCSSISFQLTGNQGAALLTKHPTYKEDIQREWAFEEYTKAHHESWVAFAREHGHGKDIRPVLVTGVDMTRDFAMACYSNNDGGLVAGFTISAPGVTSPWGIWRTTGAVYTNCGPQPCRPPSPQTMDAATSGNNLTEAVPDEYNQCVFVRYYTVRKRLGIPRVIKAAAGPHDLGPGARDNEESPFGVECSPDSGSDIAPNLFGDDGGDDGSSASSIGSESDIVFHNTTLVRSLPPHCAFFDGFG